MRRQDAASGISGVPSPDPLAANYGDAHLEDLLERVESGRVWTTVADELKDHILLIRGRAQVIRGVGKKMEFVIVREDGHTVQCVLTVAPNLVSSGMVKYATTITKESFVDIEGIITVPPRARISAGELAISVLVLVIYRFLE
ncbi:hypothetical protein L1987_00697 [Smallanthus sonchifolius]|uniref:Uncharacterized protein n=1 Tax=Smallanthus sonchifolius TaxID=185202 RepID=A0ACB9K326_9ASTR|nr:hypothetical protein L1987_00697 [Smallanthus sonchifolius]